MTTPAGGLDALRCAAADGRLDALGAAHGLRVLTVFGSAARQEPGARDLDVAVLTDATRRLDLLGLLADLQALSGVEDIDLAVLDRATPLLRERALVGCVPLFESSVGAYANAQMAAMGQRIETDAMRRLDLELLTR